MPLVLPLRLTGCLALVQDEALPIGYGQTISAPHMYVNHLMIFAPSWCLQEEGIFDPASACPCRHAAALELLERHLRPGASVLDVGSGTVTNQQCAYSPANLCRTSLFAPLLLLELFSRDHCHFGATYADVFYKMCPAPGSGYLSACMGHMVGSKGHVLGIERVPQLAQRSVPSLRRAAPELCLP